MRQEGFNTSTPSSCVEQLIPYLPISVLLVGLHTKRRGTSYKLEQ